MCVCVFFDALRVYGQPHERLCSLPVSVLFRVGSAEPKCFQCSTKKSTTAENRLERQFLCTSRRSWLRTFCSASEAVLPPHVESFPLLFSVVAERRGGSPPTQAGANRRGEESESEGPRGAGARAYMCVRTCVCSSTKRGNK